MLHLKSISKGDVETLHEKSKKYGDSWKKRGGVGAFMMLARKWDRIEKQCEEAGYDILTLLEENYEEIDGFADDIADLRRYLLLVEDEVLQRLGATEEKEIPCVEENYIKIDGTST